MSAGPGATMLVVILALAAAAPGQERFARVATAQPSGGAEALAACQGDVDGDGRDDLIVAAREEEKGRTRALLVWRRPPEDRPFAATPDLRLDLPADVVAFAAGDVHEDPGLEVVLFAAGGVFAWRTGAEGRERLVKRAACDFLFQYPSPRDIFTFEPALRDVDGDGRADLVLPEPGGFKIVFQERGEDGVARFERSSDLSIPPELDPPSSSGEGGLLRVRERGGRARVEFKLPFPTSDGDAGDPPYLDVDDAVPSAQLADWDADQDQDIVAQTTTHLLVWLQDRRAFRAAPDLALPLPVKADRARRLDISYSAQLADLDLDGHTDCVVFAGDQQAKEVRTQVLVYLQGSGPDRGRPAPAPPLFGSEGLPRSLLVLAGFVGAPDLVDLDGDRRPDLVAAVVRPDLIDKLREGDRKVIEAQVHAWLNTGQGFQRQPALSFQVEVPAEALQGARRRMAARFLGDLDGDGYADLLLRSEPDRLRVFTGRPGGRGTFILGKEPVWELRIHADADVVAARTAGGGSPGLLVIEKRQVHVVRFGP